MVNIQNQSRIAVRELLQLRQEAKDLLSLLPNEVRRWTLEGLLVVLDTWWDIAPAWELDALLAWAVDTLGVGLASDSA